jgi:hypothetical protein
VVSLGDEAPDLPAQRLAPYAAAVQQLGEDCREWQGSGEFGVEDVGGEAVLDQQRLIVLEYMPTGEQLADMSEAYGLQQLVIAANHPWRSVRDDLCMRGGLSADLNRIPITCALVVCFFLHRRLTRKQKLEDANDPHKSLDFGVDMIPTKSGKHKNIPEMTITDLGGDPMRPGRRPRGLSMDMNMSSPYLLPAGLQGSRESIHSMSRSMHDEHDPYRPVAMLRTSTDSSRPRHDNASQYSASTMQSAHDRATLLGNAQRPARSDAKRVDSMSPHTSKSSDDLPPRQMHSTNRSMPQSRKTSLGSEQSYPSSPVTAPPPRKQSLPQSLPRPPPTPEEPVPEQQSRSRADSQAAVRPPRKASLSAGTAAKDLTLAMDRDLPPPPPVPTVNEPYDIDPTMISTGRFSIDTPNPSERYPVQQQRVSVMGLRPLPTDLPEDNPEVRANRIRSFYKEYFDDSRPNPAHAHYEEDFDAAYTDGAIYDPETGGFAIPGRPFAEPVQRRAMTPPPRGAPRAADPHRRQFSTQSAGRPQFRGRPGPGPPPMPKKRAPPPKALMGLPTPHKLKDYDSVISSPIDFAPPASFRTMQNGAAPDSPTGVMRPYSPMLRPHTPLASAYDELSVMPSPHLLRKSGTFTALDFAPPNRLGAHNDTASDAGSIRSARSGISAMQLDAVRAGAYRVSRIPKEMVTTPQDLAAQLRPKMNLISPA